MLKVTSAKCQNQRVLDHMIDHGYITQVIASSYGIRRLASRIFDLTREGVIVGRQTKFDDAGVRYTNYSLVNREMERQRRDNIGLAYSVKACAIAA